mgnify:CR=1 FL=1
MSHLLKLNLIRIINFVELASSVHEFNFEAILGTRTKVNKADSVNNLSLTFYEFSRSILSLHRSQINEIDTL